MGRMGLMAARCIDPASVPVLVDLGYVNDKPTRDCADRLIAAGLAKSNFSIEGFNRLLVKLPAKKSADFIRRFRFVEGSTYFQCTHHRAALKARAKGQGGE
jgi:hypothetical protein